MKITYQLLN